ncbi:MAG: response regulator [Bacillales bacterium]|jgi:signal transduction histidine kinase|nr:response regulator [Bacillales bacterium]
MKEKIKKIGRRLFGFGELTNDQIASFESERCASNLHRIWLFSIYVIVLEVLLQILNIFKPQGESDIDLMPFIILSIASLLIAIIFCIIFSYFKKNSNKISEKVKNNFTFLYLYIYIVIQMAFLSLNILQAGTFESYVIVVMVAGLFIVIKPIEILFIGVGGGLYSALFAFFNRDKGDFSSWNRLMSTDLWTNLLIMVGIAIFVSILLYRMYVSNYTQRIKIEKINSSLERTVDDRTKELQSQIVIAENASKAKSTFLARMSHEIRTPLNAIIGLLQIIQKKEHDAVTKSHLREIKNASDHLLGLLNDILDMSKIESEDIRLAQDEFTFLESLKEVSDIIKVRAEQKEINFVADLSEVTNELVIGDKVRIKQVLINLLGNSVKFTPTGGQVTLNVKVIEDTAAFVKYHIECIDTGIGVSEEILANLFSAFQQGHSNENFQYGGSGLGLTISQHIVNLTGSKIEVSTKLGEGSNFYFDLTLAKELNNEKTNSEVVEEKFNVDLTNKRILIVEDIEINRLIVRELLSETHANIEEAVDGLDALNKVKKSPIGYYDLIFMDIMMPNMNGYEASVAIRELKRTDTIKLPIIAMTANAFREDIDRALASGMNGHIAKPINFVGVLRTLKEIFEND